MNKKMFDLKKLFLIIILALMLSTSIILSGCDTNNSDINNEDTTVLNGDNSKTEDSTNNITASDLKTATTDSATTTKNIYGKGKIIVDHTDTDITQIPSCWIDEAKSSLKIAYAHTSHGSQLISGMEAIKEYDNIYSWNSDGSNGELHLEDFGGGYNGAADLSAGETAWYQATRKFLNDKKNQDINVIMWSWCSIAGHDIEKNYIENMKKLIEEYGKGSNSHPIPVRFVIMTGHAEGGGLDDASDSRNKLIREFCSQLVGCIMFDFSDIENYDPDGKYYLDKRVTDNLDYDCKSPYNSGGQDCNWAEEYISAHKSSVNAKISANVDECAHSQSLTCALKGQAAWNLWARMAGWDGAATTCK